MPHAYTSRPPTSRSAIVSKRWYSRADLGRLTNTIRKLAQMIDEIEAIADPQPSSQYRRRVRGEPKEQDLPKTKGFIGRARRWMVDPEWLKAHPESDTKKCIADNGRLWGDATDPEELENYLKQAKIDKANFNEGKGKRKRKRMGDKKNEAGPSRKQAKGKGKAKAIEEDEEDDDDKGDDNEDEEDEEEDVFA